MNKYIILDFDSTFVTVEALDELAKMVLAKQVDFAQKISQIEQLTEAGMAGELTITESLLKRLSLINANYNDLDALVNLLKTRVSRSFRNNSEFLKSYADNIYIVSSGFKEYILPVVIEYGINPEHVFANTFTYDNAKNIIGVDETNNLVSVKGKAKCVKRLNLLGEVFVIGDGYTDYEIRAEGCANKFYAFTENISRKNVLEVADCIIPNLDEFLYQNKLPMAVSYPKHRIKVLLLENIHQVAVNQLKDEGYTVDTYTGAMGEDELSEKIKGVSILGIRSKTQVTKKVLDSADKLMAIGAFCIGTNQIDTMVATQKGVCVFNAPYSNTRSVVELAISEMIVLLRRVVGKNNKLHHGVWDKSANNCYEIRGKKLGIVGYGNIGSQLSVLAENLGMQVYYYDIQERLALGNARKCATLRELLELSDIVSLHVDGRRENHQLIGENELSMMKDGSILLNLSRGHIIDINSLISYIHRGKFLGVGLDVYPEEPKNNLEPFISNLRGLENVILTPHIGGSTQEAQYGIGEFVANRIIAYLNLGDTMQSINLPNVQLPILSNAHRLIHLHRNVPGVLAQMNQVFAKYNINILWQSLRTNESVGYTITDINKVFDDKLSEELRNIDHTIKFRVLY